MSNQHFSAPAANGSAESPMDEVVVVCPHCCEPTNDLKSLDVPYILFLFLYIAWTRDRVVACPNCMQQTLLKRTLFSVALSNVLFPISALIYCCQFFATWSSGHSDISIAEAHRMSRATISVGCTRSKAERGAPRMDLPYDPCHPYRRLLDGLAQLGV